MLDEQGRHTECYVGCIRNHKYRLSHYSSDRGAHRSGPKANPNTKSGQAKRSNFLRDVKTLHNTLDTAGVGRAGKCHSKRAERLENGNSSFLQKIHSVLVVVVQVINNVGIVIGAAT